MSSKISCSLGPIYAPSLMVLSPCTKINGSSLGCFKMETFKPLSKSKKSDATYLSNDEAILALGNFSYPSASPSSIVVMMSSAPLISAPRTSIYMDVSAIGL